MKHLALDLFLQPTQHLLLDLRVVRAGYSCGVVKCLGLGYELANARQHDVLLIWSCLVQPSNCKEAPA